MSATCLAQRIPPRYGIKDSESVEVRGKGNQVVFTYYNAEPFSMATTYCPNNLIFYMGSKYICTHNSIGNLPTNIDYFDLFIEETTFGELVNKVENMSYIETREETFRKYLRDEPIPPTKLIPTKIENDVHIIRNIFNWLFPICKYCEKRYVRYLFKLHHNDIHICKRCCWIYEIDSIEKYEVVDKIRAEVKKNVNLQSFCNMNIGVNESKSKEYEVVSH